MRFDLSAFRETRRTGDATSQRRNCKQKLRCDGLEPDAQTDMLPGEPKSAICVQRFDDSLNSAIHTTYRTWLRSSSMHEPRDPPLKVVSLFLSGQIQSTSLKKKTQKLGQLVHSGIHAGCTLDNDPSAGSPTETLLRLLLPLNDQV